MQWGGVRWGGVPWDGVESPAGCGGVESAVSERKGSSLNTTCPFGLVQISRQAFCI